LTLGWLSDIHLNFLDEPDYAGFIAGLAARRVDGWVVTGDTAEAPALLGWLERLRANMALPLHVVLGNHDFYRGSIAGVSAALRAAQERIGVVWLTHSEPVRLAEGLALVGDDGWGDGRLGDAAGSQVELNDFHLIEELRGLDRAARLERVAELGAAAAARLAPKLDAAASACRRVCVATHVPPFAGAAWHEGRPGAADWLPWFACGATGEVLLDGARRHPRTEFLVLCGHTHGGGVHLAAPNLTVHTAAAEYGRPRLQGLVVLDDLGLRVQAP